MVVSKIMTKKKKNTEKVKNTIFFNFYSRGIMYLTINVHGVKPLLPFDYSVFVKLMGRPDFGDNV